MVEWVFVRSDTLDFWKCLNSPYNLQWSLKFLCDPNLMLTNSHFDWKAASVHICQLIIAFADFCLIRLVESGVSLFQSSKSYMRNPPVFLWWNCCSAGFPIRYRTSYCWRPASGSWKPARINTDFNSNVNWHALILSQKTLKANQNLKREHTKIVKSSVTCPNLGLLNHTNSRQI